MPNTQFHNKCSIVSDTCIAMDEWVENPTADSALKDLLPCWSKETGQEVLNTTRLVSSQMNVLVNQYIINVANNDDLQPETTPLYYNQSGPLVPAICDPYGPKCIHGEIDLADVTQEWSKYVCQVSAANICNTQGRLTPSLYGQMTAAVNVSYGLYRYGSFLADLTDCTIVQEVFKDISQKYCPPLRVFSEWVYIGLVIVSASVMFSLIFWVSYSRERQHRAYTKKVVRSYAEFPLVERSRDFY